MVDAVGFELVTRRHRKLAGLGSGEFHSKFDGEEKTFLAMRAQRPVATLDREMLANRWSELLDLCLVNLDLWLRKSL